MNLRCHCPPAKPPRGFTLIELLVVLSISVILIAMAMPGLSSYVGSRTIDAQISALASSIRVARSEALKRAIPVTICPSAAPDAESPQCSPADATLGWATGWLVFTDLGNRGVIDANDTLIRVQSGFSSSSGGIIPTAGANYTLTFSASGISTGNQGNGFALKNKAAVDDPSKTRYVCISVQGSSRLSKTTCSS